MVDHGRPRGRELAEGHHQAAQGPDLPAGQFIVYWRQALQVGNQRPQVFVTEIIPDGGRHGDQPPAVVTHTVTNGSHPIFAGIGSADSARTWSQVGRVRNDQDWCI